MKTRRLFYEDVYIQEFEAIVLSCEEKDGKYKGYFPDLECCYGEGDTIDDAIDDANEAARNWLSLELTEADPFIPYVSDEEDIDLKEGEFIRNISVNIRFYEGWDE